MNTGEITSIFVHVSLFLRKHADVSPLISFLHILLGCFRIYDCDIE